MSAAARAAPVGASAMRTMAATAAIQAACALSRPRSRGMTSSTTNMPSRLYARGEEEDRHALRAHAPPPEARHLRRVPRGLAAQPLVAGVPPRLPPALRRRPRRGRLLRVLRRDARGVRRHPRRPALARGRGPAAAADGAVPRLDQARGGLRGRRGALAVRLIEPLAPGFR